MSQDRVALYLQDAHELREGMKIVQYAEKHGFEAVWQAESRLVRDAIVPMAAFAAVTERIKVGSGVINNWTRNIGSHYLRHWRLVGPIGGQCRDRTTQAAARHARDP